MRRYTHSDCVQTGWMATCETVLGRDEKRAVFPFIFALSLSRLLLVRDDHLDELLVVDVPLRERDGERLNKGEESSLRSNVPFGLQTYRARSYVMIGCVKLRGCYFLAEML